MFKLVLTVRKRDGLTREAFIEHYERRHTILVRQMVPPAPLYRRNYIIDGAEIAGIPATGTAEAGFDCITEVGFETRAEAEAHVAAYLNPKNHPIIAADEANFIHPDGLRFYIVEVRQSPGREPAVQRNDA